VVFGQVDFAPWEPVVAEMHRKGHWVACIDPYIDKRLLEELGSCEGAHRKIIGFSCGHGLYGKLNLTVSTEADTLARLTELICLQLGRLFAVWSTEMCEQAAKTIVAEAQELPGLSLIRAIGSSEYIRDVVAYALVRRLVADRNAVITTLVPIDSFRHWFEGAEVEHIPDLLYLKSRGGDTLVRATVIECKLARRSEQHVTKFRTSGGRTPTFTRIFSRIVTCHRVAF
jgi:DNA phosphorothioation-dependent restriction protein DptH